jgi:PAS domain S-box-containing protein
MPLDHSILLKQCRDASHFMAALRTGNARGEASTVTGLLGQLNSVVEDLCTAVEELMQQKEALCATRDDLLVQQRHYQDLFALAPDGYLVTRPDGVIIESNLAAARLLKVNGKQLCGRSLTGFILSEQHNLFRQKLTTLLNSRQTSSYTWKMQLKPRSGEPVYVMITASSTKEETAGVKDVRWLLHDISQDKQIEMEREMFLARLVNAHEEERARIARELHDNTAQHLTALIVGLQSLKQSNQNQAISTREFDQLQRISEEMVSAVHQIAVDQRPPSLDDLGLPSALFNYARGWSRRTGMPLSIHISGFENTDRLPPDIGITIYRIVQESLTNVSKHSKALGASLILERRDDHVLAIVEDDGIGFDTKHKSLGSASLGLIGMRERAALVGGTIEIESKPDHGTTVFLRISIVKSRLRSKDA